MQPPIIAPPTPDAEHLKLLALGFRIHGTLVAGFGCCYLMAMSTILGAAKSTPPKAGQAPFPDTFFTAFLGFFVLAGLIFGGLSWLAAQRIDERRGYTFVLVMTSISLLFQPIGLVLGILGIIVLVRPSVKALFDGIPR